MVQEIGVPVGMKHSYRSSRRTDAVALYRSRTGTTVAADLGAARDTVELDPRGGPRQHEERSTSTPSCLVGGGERGSAQGGRRAEAGTEDPAPTRGRAKPTALELAALNDPDLPEALAGRLPEQGRPRLPPALVLTPDQRPDAGGQGERRRRVRHPASSPDLRQTAGHRPCSGTMMAICCSTKGRPWLCRH